MKGILLVALSSIAMLLSVPLFGQSGASVFIVDHPKAFHFSTQKDLSKGVKTGMTLGVVAPSSFGRWNLLVHANGNLMGDFGQIPISTIQVKAKGKASCRGRKEVALSTQTQCIARSTHQQSEMDYVELNLTAKGGGQYINKPAGLYSTTIVFSLVAD